MKKTLVGALALAVTALGSMTVINNDNPTAAANSVIQISALPELVRVGDNTTYVASVQSEAQETGSIVVTLPNSTTNLTYTTLLDTPCTVQYSNKDARIACYVPETPYSVTIKAKVGMGRSPLESRAEWQPASQNPIQTAVDYQYIRGVKVWFLPVIFR